MPNMSEMQCHICESIVSVEEISENDGMCRACNDAMKDIPETPTDETDPEIRGAIQRYQARQSYMKKYNQRPDVQAARKAYMKGRQQRDRALIRRAKELRLIDDHGRVVPNRDVREAAQPEGEATPDDV